MAREVEYFYLKEVANRKFVHYDFSERFHDLLGDRVVGATWIIYGKSGQGKTRFALELAREFERQGKSVLFASLEMGISKIFLDEIKEAGILPGNSAMKLCEAIKLDELKTLLKKQRSPSVVIVDSIQYWDAEENLEFSELLRLFKRCSKTTFVFLSHVEGKEVEGKLAYQIKRECDTRILIEGFKAILTGRGKGGKTGEYVIWEEGAARYWLKDNDNEEIQ